MMLWLFLIVLECADAQQLPPIKFAGIWVRGNASDAEKLCPIGYQYALSAEPDEKIVAYNRNLHAELVKYSKENGPRVIDNIAKFDYMPDSALGNAYVMACALKYEMIEAGTLPGGQRGTFAEIGFDLIICNFSDRSVVVSIPCRLVLQDHGEKNLQNMIDLYEKHLPEALAKIAEVHWYPGLFFKTIGITSTNILIPEDMDEVPDNMVGFPEGIQGNHHLISSHIAASRFYDKTGIPVQPYSSGEEAVFYGLRENLVNAPDLRSKQLMEQIKGSGFLLKKTNYEMAIRGAYFRVRNGGFENYICKYRMIIQNEAGDEIFNFVDQAASDGIPFRGENSELLWHYQADATVRMFEKFADQIIHENKKGNVDIRKMWIDVIDSKRLN